jgi:hypothetical protein
MRASYRLRSNLREADCANPTRFHEIRDGADRVLDRNARVEAAGAIDVHMIEAETRERVGQEVLDRGWASIEA